MVSGLELLRSEGSKSSKTGLGLLASDKTKSGIEDIRQQLLAEEGEGPFVTKSINVPDDVKVRGIARGLKDESSASERIRDLYTSDSGTVFWTSNFAQQLGQQGMFPQPSGGWDELGRPLDELGKPYQQAAAAPEAKIPLISRLKDAAIAIGEEALATSELTMSLASGMLLYFPSKLYGLMALPFGREVADIAEMEIAKLGYQPFTEKGKAAAELVGKGFELFLSPAHNVGELVSRLSPEAGYLVEFGTELAEFTLTGGIVKGAKAKFKPSLKQARRLTKARENLENDTIKAKEKAVEDITDQKVKSAQQAILEIEKTQKDLGLKNAEEKFAKNLEPIMAEELARKAEEVARIKQLEPAKEGQPWTQSARESTADFTFESQKGNRYYKKGDQWYDASGNEVGNNFVVKAAEAGKVRVGEEIVEPKPVDKITDLDLQTTTREPVELSTHNSPFRQEAEDTNMFTKSFEKLGDKVDQDMETFVGKRTNDINRWLDGDESVDIAKTRDDLSQLAVDVADPGNRIVLEDMFDGDAGKVDNFIEFVSEAASWARRAEKAGGNSLLSGTPTGTKLYDIGGATAKGAKQLIDLYKSAKRKGDEARGMKKFRPGYAAKAVKQELKRDFVDRSGNIRVDMIDKIGRLGYEAIYKMYLAKGAPALAAKNLRQMQKEVFRGLSRKEKHIVDDLIFHSRILDIAKYKTSKQFKELNNYTPEEAVTFLEFFGPMEKLSPGRAHELYHVREDGSIGGRTGAYFDWMRKVLKDMLEAELITDKEFNDLSSHNYRRVKVLEIFDKKRPSISKKGISVYDSGIEALARGRDMTVFERSADVMALEVFSRAYGRILNNAANKQLLEIARSHPDNPFVRLKEAKGDKIPTGWNRIFVYEKGERKPLYISPEMSKEWLLKHPEISYKAGQILRYASGSVLLRTFATGINWGFALANLPRDVMHTWFAASHWENGKWKAAYSPHAPVYGAQITRDLLTTFSDALLRKGRYDEYINEGGGMEFMVHQGRLLQRGRHLEGPIDKIYDFLGYLGETTEIMTRLAIRERAMRKGLPSQEATFVARDYMDFGQGGGIAKAADNGIPYLNAGTQGARGMFRAFKERKIESIYKLAQFAALTTGLYIAAKHYAKKTTEDVKRSMDSRNNLIIPLPDSFRFVDDKGQERGIYFKIPLDPGQRFFKKFFEASTDKWLGEEIDVEGTVEGLKSLSPVEGISGIIPPLISSVLGYFTNKDFWLNEDIWKQSEPFSHPKSKKEYTSRTPEFYVDIGEATGISPERLKYSVEELVTSGTVYSYLLGEGYDKLFGDMPETKRQQSLAMVLSKLPVVRRFIGVTNPYSKYGEKFDKAQENAVYRTFVENNTFDILVESYLYGEGTIKKDVINEAKKYKDIDTYDRLIDRFEFEIGIKDLPNKSFWRRMKGLRTEAKAEVFVDRLNSSSPEEKKELWREYDKARLAGGVVSGEFLTEVENLLYNTITIDGKRQKIIKVPSGN
uniref:Uncharacterized protein n=1 Tax=viral metagenome TaxID=1070528 RepID=A0A6M3KFV5_9ZZZZ